MKTSEMMRDIALYMEGLKAGKGDLSPLGTLHLTELWKVVKDYQNLEREIKESCNKQHFEIKNDNLV